MPKPPQILLEAKIGFFPCHYGYTHLEEQAIKLNVLCSSENHESFNVAYSSHNVGISVL